MTPVQRRARVAGVGLAVLLAALLVLGIRGLPGPTEVSSEGSPPSELTRPAASSRAAPPRPATPEALTDPLPSALSDGASSDEDLADAAFRCPMEMDLPYDGEVRFLESLPLDGGGIHPVEVSARIIDGVLVAEVQDPDNAGWVEIPGYPTMRWEAGREGACPTLHLEARSGVVGTVGPLGGDLTVSACGTRRPVDEDGSFYVPAEPGRCRVSASRKDGDITVYGDEETVEVVAGQDAEVDLSVPEETWGTVGLTMSPTPPVRVRQIMPDSVAEEAGIVTGDVVLTVDGASAEGCDRGWLRSCLHGPEGTEVVLEVEGKGTISLVRHWVDPVEE